MTDLVIEAIQSDPTRTRIKIMARIEIESIVLEFFVKPNENVGRIIKYGGETSEWLSDHAQFTRALGRIIFDLHDSGIPETPIIIPGPPKYGPVKPDV